VKRPSPIVLDYYIDRVFLTNVEHAQSRFLRSKSATLLLFDGCRNLTIWIFAMSVITNIFNSISKLEISQHQQNNQDSLKPCPNLVLDFVYIYCSRLFDRIFVE